MNKKTDKEKLENIRIPFMGIPSEAKQRFANECKAIEISKSADGRGLSTGADIDYHLVNGFLPDELKEDFEKYHKGEADVRIVREPASFKTMRGKGETALSWSKNPGTKKDGSPSINRGFLVDPIPMIMYVRESKRWWKNGPKNPRHESIEWNREIKSGFYFIDVARASYYIQLTANNKSDAIIDSQDMYRMLVDASDEGNFVEVPEPKGPVMKLRFAFEY